MGGGAPTQPWVMIWLCLPGCMVVGGTISTRVLESAGFQPQFLQLAVIAAVLEAEVWWRWRATEWGELQVPPAPSQLQLQARR